jgi:hypothetical protein
MWSSQASADRDLQCNGINGRLSSLLAWLNDAARDIVCLRELKVPYEKFPEAGIRAAGYVVAPEFSLRCASMRRKISPGIWGMSAKMAPQLVSRVSPGLQA